MQHILGTILKDNDIEIIEDESPGKGSYMGLQASIFEGQKILKQNPNIKQINIYRIIQEQRILTYQLFPEANN